MKSPIGFSVQESDWRFFIMDIRFQDGFLYRCVFIDVFFFLLKKELQLQPSTLLLHHFSGNDVPQLTRLLQGVPSDQSCDKSIGVRSKHPSATQVRPFFCS
jgi:hypothetical protein